MTDIKKLKIQHYIRKIKEFYVFSNSKRATTFAGGLAYFFFAGIVPFFGLVTVIFSLLDIDSAQIKTLFQSDVFSVFFERLQSEGADRAATLIMGITAAYAATHFYFHLIRTGENVYESNRSGGAIKRVLSFCYLFIVQLLLIIAVSIELFGNKVLSFFGFSDVVVGLTGTSLSLAFNLVLSIVLHLFAAPAGYKNLKFIFKGVLLSFVYWEVCGLFFRLTQKGASGDFGFAAVAVFLLYLYFLMRGLVYGMVINAIGESSDRIGFIVSGD